VTDLKKTVLMYSYLVLLNGKELAPHYSPKEFIAITERLSGKGREEIVGCGPSGRIRFVRSARDVSKENAAMDALGRGSFFTVPDMTVPEEFVLEHRVPVKPGTKILI
jgi:hypothetical protein